MTGAEMHYCHFLQRYACRVERYIDGPLIWQSTEVGHGSGVEDALRALGPITFRHVPLTPSMISDALEQIGH
jgi:hypothetical protein